MAEGTLQPSANAAIYPSLAGKKVIVSGGASGIGEGIVEGFDDALADSGAATADDDALAGQARIDRPLSHRLDDSLRQSPQSPV